MNTTTMTFAAALLAALACQAQDERKGPPQGGERPPHPPMPLVAVLDADRDHKISAEEIEGSPTALKKLDENGDGDITREELRPKPPKEDAEGQEGPPPEEEGEGDRQSRRQRRPVPPLFATLDTDKDGTISADEIEAAPKSLVKLDKNEDGELTPREFNPQGPPRGEEGQRRPRKNKD
jgi:hypothetical protein